MNDLNRSGNSPSGKASDFGYKLYVHNGKLFFGAILVGIVIALCFYPFLPIHDRSTWRAYFYYGPLVIGMGFVVLNLLLLEIICPRKRQVNFETFLTSVDRWRELDIRNKGRLFLGVILVVGGGLVIGWIIGGWAGFIF